MREKLSRPFSFRPRVSPGLAQRQREVRPQERPRVDERHPALFAFRAGLHTDLHRRREEYPLARARVLFVDLAPLGSRRHPPGREWAPDYRVQFAPWACLLEAGSPRERWAQRLFVQAGSRIPPA